MCIVPCEAVSRSRALMRAKFTWHVPHRLISNKARSKFAALLKEPPDACTM